LDSPLDGFLKMPSGGSPGRFRRSPVPRESLSGPPGASQRSFPRRRPLGQGGLQRSIPVRRGSREARRTKGLVPRFMQKRLCSAASFGFYRGFCSAACERRRLVEAVPRDGSGDGPARHSRRTSARRRRDLSDAPPPVRRAGARLGDRGPKAVKTARRPFARSLLEVPFARSLFEVPLECGRPSGGREIRAGPLLGGPSFDGDGPSWRSERALEAVPRKRPLSAEPPEGPVCLPFDLWRPPKGPLLTDPPSLETAPYDGVGRRPSLTREYPLSRGNTL